MMKNLVLSLFLILLIPYLARAQPITNQNWQTATIVGDAIAINCARLFLPFELGRLISDPNPITSRGEMDESFRSAHSLKVELSPQSGTADNLNSITGCSVATRLQLATQNIGDTITVLHTPGVIEFPDGINKVLDHPIKILNLILKNGIWVLDNGFGGAGGSSGGNIVVQDGQKVDFSILTLDNNIEGLFLPHASNCNLMTGLWQFCLDEDDLRIFVGTPTGVRQISGTGQAGSGCTDLDDCFDQRNIIDGIDVAPMIIMDSNHDGVKIQPGASGTEIVCVNDISHPGNPGGTDTPCTPTERRSVEIPMGKFSPDGTLATYNFTVTLGSETVPVTITHSDNNASTMRAKIAMPDSWDGLFLRVYSFLHTEETTPGGSIDIDWSGYCVESGQSSGTDAYPDDTVANAAMDISLAGLSTGQEVITATVGSIPLTGCTGANKKSLWLRGQIDAGGTNASDMNLQHFTLIQIEYGLKSYSDD